LLREKAVSRGSRGGEQKEKGIWMEGVSASWAGSEKQQKTLDKVHLSLPMTALLLVNGQVGSGKVGLHLGSLRYAISRTQFQTNPQNLLRPIRLRQVAQHLGTWLVGASYLRL